MQQTIVVFWLVWGLHFACAATEATQPHARTPWVTYVGTRIKLKEYKAIRPAAYVDQYLGIQYGVVKKRFAKAKPAWLLAEQNTVSGNRKIAANQFAPACMQQAAFVEFQTSADASKARSEKDCLSLNIWVPSTQEANTSNDTVPAKLAVFVWFHGGSFISDSTSRKLYIGSHLAEAAQMIVVTVNYRVDAFGFLYLGANALNRTESAPGNQALWDQTLALEWVHEHIESFGGDATKVTIAGHNSGATSVGLHLLSPQSEPFFAQALLMSGSIFTQTVSQSSAVALEIENQWAKSVHRKLKCDENKDSDLIVSALHCAQQATSEDVLRLLDPLSNDTETNISPEIIVGDQFLPFDNLRTGVERLRQTWRARNRTPHIMMGGTDDEGSLVLPLISMRTFSMNGPMQLTRNETTDHLKSLSERLVLPRGAQFDRVNGEEVARHYLSQIATVDQTANKDSTLYARLIGQALGDFYVSCPMVEFAAQLADNGGHVYQYVWSRKLESDMTPEVPCANWMGACHGTDVAMLFGGPFQDAPQVDAERQRASLHFMKTIGHFAATGEPLKQEQKSWPPYAVDSTGSKRQIRPYYEFSNLDVHSKRIYKRDWKRDLCADLWQKYLTQPKP